MNNIKLPPFLKRGDTVQFVSMAGVVDKQKISFALQVLEKYGLKGSVAPHAFHQYHNFAGTEEQRIQDLQNALDDPHIDAIISSRGGYGITKIIDQLDFSQFIINPKWIVGFSDITGLHLHLHQLGIASIHGPMGSTFSFDEMSSQALVNILLGTTSDYTFSPSKYNKLGSARGEAIGGNLCLLAHSTGSPSEVSFDNKILFIEDIGEYEYAIDRYLVQLKRSGKFNQLAGLVVGDFSDLKHQKHPFGSGIEATILAHFAEFNYPIAFNFEFGHEKKNLPIIFGQEYTLEVNQNSSTLRIPQKYALS